MSENGTAPVPVCLDFAELCDHNNDLGLAIETAFGVNGLGLITIKNVPAYPTLRRALLPLAARLAQLNDDQKAALEDPLSSYNFGWSQGKEKLENGAPDANKGSFYANPLIDCPTEDPTLLEEQPAYCRSNIWPPAEQVPQVEPAFKALGKVMYDVGMLVTAHCSRYLEKNGISVNPPLQEILTRSNCHKGRLLCYLPPPETNPAHSNGSAATAAGGAETTDITTSQQWCGWHTDHGSITGLASAMYTDSDGNEVACGDPQAGLYVKNRLGEMVRIVIPSDHIAFQLGEVFQILSGGTLLATPHCVVAPRSRPEVPSKHQQVYRNTFALFMQPRWDEILHCPDGIDPGNVEIDAWKDGMSFGAFSKKRFENYY